MTLTDDDHWTSLDKAEDDIANLREALATQQRENQRLRDENRELNTAIGLIRAALPPLELQDQKQVNHVHRN